VLDLGRRRVEVLPALHTVPAVGYAVLAPNPEGGDWVFTGDTGPNPALWQRLAQRRVATLVIETAFGDDEHTVARLSRHLCPADLRLELELLRPGADIQALATGQRITLAGG
jgi:ribonuclease BN (tRNA processing enzyme)